MKDFVSFNVIVFICNYFIWCLEKSWLIVLFRDFDIDFLFYVVLNLFIYYLLYLYVYCLIGYFSLVEY